MDDTTLKFYELPVTADWHKLQVSDALKTGKQIL